MTLISCIYNYGMPILTGDLLLTTSQDVEPQYIPVLNRKAGDKDFEQKKFKPFAYTQKLYVINPKLAVALAGNTFEMKTLLTAVQDHFKYVSITPENFWQFIHEFDFAASYANSSAVLICSEIKEGQSLCYAHLQGSFIVNDNVSYDRCASSGTGAPTWLDFLNKTAGLLDDGTTIKVRHGINKCLLSNLHFLSVEEESPDNLLEGWGGGFEIINYDERGFHKLEATNYIFYKGEFDGENLKVEPRIIINFRYHEDILLISCFNRIGPKMYVIYPLGHDKTKEVELPTQFDFSSYINCFKVNLTSPKGEIPGFYFSNVTTPEMEPEGPPVHSKDIDGYLSFVFNLVIEAEMKKMAKMFYDDL